MASSFHQSVVLLAEDDADLRSQLADELRRRGYGVVEVDSGGALLDSIAVAFMRNSREPTVQVIVSDIRMPGWSGMQVLAGLRSSGFRVPAILTTAQPDDSSRAAAEDLDALLLRKPFEFADLERAVAAALRPRARSMSALAR